MSQAESLLNSIAAYPTNDTTVSTSPINDYLIIDAEGRIVNVPATETLFGVETDVNAERKYFRCPRIVGDNIDLTKLGLRVHYRNAKGEDDGYIVDDVKVDGEFITFSWKLGGKLFKAKGTIYFAICAVNVDDNGVETCVWNTTLASGNVLEGLRVKLTETEEEQTRDILQQLLNLLQTKSNEAVQAVNKAGSDRVLDIEAEAIVQMNAIESKGAKTLATIPEDYTSTYNAADDALRKKASAILLEEEGTVISVSDASDDYVRGLKVFGKSEQVSTTGKNLLRITAKTQTLNGVTFTVNADGSITANGTAENTIYLSIGTYSVEPDKYILSGCTGGSDRTYLIYSQKAADASGYVHCVNGGTEFDISDNDARNVLIAVYSGVTVSNVTFYPMIRLATIEDSTYEPYTGCKPAPNPEYPQEIVSLGDNGGLNVIVGSRNLFNKKSTNESNSMTLFPGTYYCKRFFGDSTETNARLHIKIGDSWKTIESIGKYDNSNIIVEGSAFSWYENKQKITLKKSYELFYGLLNNEKLTIAVNEYLESYEDDNNTTITIPRSLPGIPVTSDGNYTDSYGQQWICDEMDFERGVYVKRVSENVITSDMHVTLKTDRADCNQFAFELLKYDDTVFVSRSVPGLCNKFKRGLYTVDCFDIGTVADSGWGGKSRVTFYADKSITTVEAFMEYIGEDCVILSPLPTPIETPLTADELNAFRALHTNYPNTVVLNDSGAMMALLYNADTKLFVRRNAGGSGGSGGVGIESIMQTTKSTIDDGINIITITFTNGDKTTFEIQNGSKGSTGANGANGKTPVKGTDYFTDVEKQEIVTDVLGSLPTWTGGSY